MVTRYTHAFLLLYLVLRARRPRAVPVEDQIRAGDRPGPGRVGAGAVFRRRRVRQPGPTRRDA